MIPYIILADPTDITIQRHLKADNGAGGFSLAVSDTTSYPITVRLYFYSAGAYSMRNMREFTLPEGEVKEIVLGLLAPYGTDIEVGHDSYDTFVYEDRTYRIVGKRVYDHFAPTACMQCDCVAV